MLIQEVFGRFGYYYRNKGSVMRRIIEIITVRLKNKVTVEGKKNKLYFRNVNISKCRIQVRGNNNTIHFMPGTFIQNTFLYINGDNNRIFVDEHCRYAGGALYIEDNDSEIIIGRFTGVESANIASTENGNSIKIGEGCLFSTGIEIRNGDSHSIFSLETRKRINYGRKVEIGNRVWIGAQVTVLKGVTVAEDSVIAAGSVVSKSVLDKNSIYGGNPAVKIKDNIYWNGERVDDRFQKN